MRMTVEMAADMGLIPDVSPYKKTGRLGPWQMDRHKTNEEYEKAEKKLWSPFGFDEEDRTVEVNDDKL